MIWLFLIYLIVNWKGEETNSLPFLLHQLQRELPPQICKCNHLFVCLFLIVQTQALIKLTCDFLTNFLSDWTIVAVLTSGLSLMYSLLRKEVGSIYFIYLFIYSWMLTLKKLFSRRSTSNCSAFKLYGDRDKIFHKVCFSKLLTSFFFQWEADVITLEVADI